MRGARLAWTGFALIRVPAIRPFVVWPLLFNTLLFAGGLWAAANLLEQGMDRLIPPWLDWLRYVLWPLFAVVGLAVVLFGFSILANLFGAPFNGMLAAAVERHLRGDAPAQQAPGLGAVLREAARSVWAELRKLRYFALLALPCLLLSFVPGVNLLAPFVWLVYGAWMLAVEYVDCPLGNHGLAFPAARDLLRRRRALALGFGSTMTLLTLVPIVNFVAMPVGVAAATALYLECLEA